MAMYIIRLPVSRIDKLTSLVSNHVIHRKFAIGYRSLFVHQPISNYLLEKSVRHLYKMLDFKKL